MMKRIWPLLKVQLKSTMRGSLRNMTGTQSKWGLLMLPLLLLSFIPLIAMFTVGYVGLYGVLAYMGQGHVLLTMTLTAGQLLCLVFGVFYVISTFYFSKDLRILVPLPIRPSEIVITKFITVLIGEYLTMAPVVLPALVIYGVMADVGLLYVPLALLIYLMLPVVPMVLASLFSILLMRVTNLKRNRDLLRVFGALVGVGFAILLQFWGRMGQENGSKEAVESLLASQQPLIQSMGKWVLTSAWGTDALREGATALGLPSFLLFAALVGVAVLLLMQGAEWLFFGGLLGGDESTSSGRKLSRDELAQETGRVRSPLWALFLREFRLLNRTPSFLMAGVLPPLLIPLFLVIPLSSADGPLAAGSNLAQYADSPWVPIALLGILLMINSVSAIPSSAVSREGRWFWVSRSLPVRPRIQIQAKLLHSLLFSMLNLAMMIGVTIWQGLVTPLNLAVLLAGGLLTGLVTGYSGLLVDVARPSLTWTDPQQAMKGNLNSLFAMLVNLILALVMGGVTALLFFFLPSLLLPGLLILLALLGWALGKATIALAEKRYVEYEI